MSIFDFRWWIRGCWHPSVFSVNFWSCKKLVLGLKLLGVELGVALTVAEQFVVGAGFQNGAFF